MFRVATALRLGWSPRVEAAALAAAEEAASASAPQQQGEEEHRGLPAGAHISWNEEVLVREIPNLDDYSCYDIEMLWWAREDFVRFREAYHTHALMDFPDMDEEEDDAAIGADDYDYFYNNDAQTSFDYGAANDPSGYGGDAESCGYAYASSCYGGPGQRRYVSSSSDEDTSYPSSGSESPSEDEGGDDGMAVASPGVRALFALLDGHESGHAMGGGGAGSAGSVQAVPFGVPRYQAGAPSGSGGSGGGGSGSGGGEPKQLRLRMRPSLSEAAKAGGAGGADGQLQYPIFA